MEKLQLTDTNDSTRNGTFSTSSSHQTSSKVHSSSSSYVVETVDGKERIVDKKHHESGHATQSNNEEHLATKTGTNITPEVHYTQKTRESETKYDSAQPELQQPKTKSSESSREIHQVGDQTTSSINIIPVKAISDGSEHFIRDNTRNLINTEMADTINKYIDTSGSAKTIPGGTVNVQTTTKTVGGKSTVTTTTTHYDSKGNVVKTVTEVDGKPVSGSIQTSSRKAVDEDKRFIKDSDTTTTYVDENHVDIAKNRARQMSTDSRNFYGHGVDSRNNVVRDIYNTSAVQNTIGTKGRVMKDNTIDSTDVIYSNDRNYGKTGWNGSFTYETPQKPKRNM